MVIEIAKQVGIRIKQCRESRGLTQAQLAQALGKSIETISNFERGKVATSLHTLEQIAVVLHVRVRDFFDDAEISGIPADMSANAVKVRNAAELLPEDDLEIVAGVIDVLGTRTNRGR